MQLMQSKLWTLLAACLCGTALLSVAAAAEPKERLKGVETEALLKRPQNYWSVGISFKDTVLEADGRQITILEKPYYSVELKELGVAFASDQGLAQIEKNGLNRQYLLTGTVLHERKGFFKKTDHYYIIILEAVPTVITETAEIAEGLDQLSLSDDHPATQHMLDLFSSTQRDLINLAKELEVPTEDLFRKDSKNSEEARDIVRRALRKVEVTQEIPSSEILSGFIFHMLSRKFTESSETNEPAEKDSGAPESKQPEDAVVGEPMDDYAEEPVGIQRAPIIALDTPEPVPPAEEPAAQPETPTAESTVTMKAEPQEPLMPPQDLPTKIKPAPVIATETASETREAQGALLFSDDKPLPAPDFAVDPLLADDKPVGKTVKPRRKAKPLFEPTLPPTKKDDAFAPVGR